MEEAPQSSLRERAKIQILKAEIARLTAELAQVRDILTDRENTITRLTAEQERLAGVR